MNNKLASILTAATVLVSASAAIAETSCDVSLAQYKRLENGMTYQTVVSVLGCEGTEIVSTGTGKFKTEGFMWDGNGSVGANMNVMFQNGKLMMRAQFGLK